MLSAYNYDSETKKSTELSKLRKHLSTPSQHLFNVKDYILVIYRLVFCFRFSYILLTFFSISILNGYKLIHGKCVIDQWPQISLYFLMPLERWTLYLPYIIHMLLRIMIRSPSCTAITWVGYKYKMKFHYSMFVTVYWFCKVYIYFTRVCMCLSKTRLAFLEKDLEANLSQSNPIAIQLLHLRWSTHVECLKIKN